MSSQYLFDNMYSFLILYIFVLKCWLLKLVGHFYLINNLLEKKKPQLKLHFYQYLLGKIFYLDLLYQLIFYFYFELYFPFLVENPVVHHYTNYHCCLLKHQVQEF